MPFSALPNGQSLVRKFLVFAVMLSLLSLSHLTLAQNKTLWGVSKSNVVDYKPQKVVYDVITGDLDEMQHVLNRSSYLSKITGADPFEQSIVLVLHGSSIPFFATANTEKYQTMLQRAQSLSESEVITIKMCELSAQSQGFQAEDIHGFVKMVPMGDAEIIRLQYEEDHAYMQ